MRVLVAAALCVTMAAASAAQTAPPIRQIGALERITPDSIPFKSIPTALAMPGGRVLVNDPLNRRAVLLDSTLTHTTVVADTTDATAEAYGRSWATMIRFRGDSALLMVPSTLSMLVILPNGRLVRTMAFPQPDYAQQLAGSWGVPGLDSRGRIVYFGGNLLPGIMMLTQGMQLLEDGKPTEIARRLTENPHAQFRLGKLRADSSPVLAIDLGTR